MQTTQLFPEVGSFRPIEEAIGAGSRDLDGLVRLGAHYMLCGPGGPGSHEFDGPAELTEALRDLIAGILVRGLCGWEVETRMQQILEGRDIPRIVVRLRATRLVEGLVRLLRRSLALERFLFILLDGTCLKLRFERAEKEPVLFAHGVREDGERVLLGIAAGSRESSAAWEALVRDLRSRGVEAPLIAVTDDNAGVRGLR